MVLAPKIGILSAISSTRATVSLGIPSLCIRIAPPCCASTKSAAISVGISANSPSDFEFIAETTTIIEDFENFADFAYSKNCADFVWSVCF